MSGPVRIVLADDHPIFLHGLKELLRADSTVQIVGEASSGGKALELVRAEAPDVAVLDISMPGPNGIAVARRIVAECPQVRIVLLTGQEDRVYIDQALQIGVSGYVLKRSVTENLIHAIHAAARKGTYIDPTVAGDTIRNAFAVRKPEGKSSGQRLSPRETDVLRLTARGQTNKEIAQHMQVSIKTVETFKARAMAKFGLRSRADIVRYIVAQGWFEEK